MHPLHDSVLVEKKVLAKSENLPKDDRIEDSQQTDVIQKGIDNKMSLYIHASDLSNSLTVLVYTLQHIIICHVTASNVHAVL